MAPEGAGVALVLVDGTLLKSVKTPPRYVTNPEAGPPTQAGQLDLSMEVHRRGGWGQDVEPGEVETFELR